MLKNMPDIERFEPLVLIVIPVFNGENYLAESIDSCLEQNYKKIKIIIVDNCSTDRTPEISNKYSIDYENVSYVRHEDFVTIGENWSRAVKIAEGQECYVKLLCADDVLLPGNINKAVSILESNASIGLVTSYESFFGSSSGVRDGACIPYTGYVNKKDAINSVIKRGNWIGNPTGVLFRYNGLFKSDLQWMVDVEYWLRLLAVYDMYVIPECLYGTRRHDKQLTENGKVSNEFLKEELSEVRRYCSEKKVYSNISPVSCGYRIAYIMAQLSFYWLRTRFVS